jgi:ParB-like chromosome segregation protein Spo0J
MHDRGLINPITVGPREGLRYQLIAGHHRYVAARKLEWEKIPAIVLKGLDAVDAELCEIDENLIRADLTQAEQAAHHARRKELYEQKHPETKPTNRAGPGRGKTRRQNGNESADRYTKNTAEETGDSERTIQRAVKRGNDIPNVAELAGTSLDQGAELDALAKLKDIAPDRQAELIEQAKEGEKVSAKAEINARGRNQSRKPKPAASGTEQTPPAVNDARDDVAQPDKPAPEPPQRDLAAVVGELPAPESADPASLLDTIRATIRGLTNIDFDQVATIPANHLLEVRSELDEAAGELRAVITQAIESATVREKEPPPASRGVREGDYGLA